MHPAFSLSWGGLSFETAFHVRFPGTGYVALGTVFKVLGEAESTNRLSSCPGTSFWPGRVLAQASNDYLLPRRSTYIQTSVLDTKQTPLPYFHGGTTTSILSPLTDQTHLLLRRFEVGASVASVASAAQAFGRSCDAAYVFVSSCRIRVTAMTEVAFVWPIGRLTANGKMVSSIVPSSPLS